MKTKLKLTKLHVLVSVLLIIISSVLVLYGVILHNYRNDIETARMARLITKSIEPLKQPTVVDPLSGKNYIPSARLVLPTTTEDFGNIGQTLYDHQPRIDNQSEEVSITSKRVITAAESHLLTKTDMEEMFEQVPRLQACARGIKIRFEPANNQDSAATKTLADGRTAHIYTEPLCGNSVLLDYVKHIESY